MTTLFDPAPEADQPGKPPAPTRFPDRYAGFDRIGAMIPPVAWRALLDVIAQVEVERKRSGRQYWTFDQYERIFAAAMDGRQLVSLIEPLVAMRVRYLRARAARLSPFQFWLAEERLRADHAANDARLANEHLEAQKRSAQKAYRAMVAEAELKERARREARENVERERPSRPSGRVAKPTPARAERYGSYYEPANAPPVLSDGGDEQEYIAPHVF